MSSVLPQTQVSLSLPWLVSVRSVGTSFSPHLLWPAPALLLWTLEQVRCFCSQGDPGTFLNKAVPLEALRCSACSRPQMCSFPGAAGGRSPALRSRETRVMLPLPVPAAGGPECARLLRLQRQGCRSWSCRGRWPWRWAWRGAFSPPPLPLPRPAPSSVLPFSVSLGVGEWFTGWKGSRIWGNLPHTSVLVPSVTFQSACAVNPVCLPRASVDGTLHTLRPAWGSASTPWPRASPRCF